MLAGHLRAAFAVRSLPVIASFAEPLSDFADLAVQPGDFCAEVAQGGADLADRLVVPAATNAFVISCALAMLHLRTESVMELLGLSAGLVRHVFHAGLLQMLGGGGEMLDAGADDVSFAVAVHRQLPPFGLFPLAPLPDFELFPLTSLARFQLLKAGPFSLGLAGVLFRNGSGIGGLLLREPTGLALILEGLFGPLPFALGDSAGFEGLLPGRLQLFKQLVLALAASRFLLRQRLLCSQWDARPRDDHKTCENTEHCARHGWTPR